MIKYLFFLFITFNLNAETLRVVTSDFPPFQMAEGNKVSGITTEIVEAVINNAGFKSDIKIYPWPRAYKMGLRESNVLIYSIVRTPERDKLFKWIGSIAPYNVYFWKLKSRKDIKINSIEDARHYKAGGVIDDNKADQLRKLGFVVGKNLDLVSSDELNLRTLYAGRIDIMTFDDLSFRHKVLADGKDFDKLEKIMKLEGSSHEMQLAANIDTPDAVVEKLRRSLIAFKKTNKYQQIKNRLR
ncbi:transporter substrate-binding domain-containing protein [Bacteriovorax sp. PP10]|uniref:Transporter substrate-binding domain-containing protein n=1 Tax=Bacteriovorax antarcticus TaxID=3088717 RepID=A0ABU5VZ75_9BACT|nr:transporter substrate-binding domain-containing protein [Bacteriovorax sp. PP10]MEA9358357.1 transporter substrate-binding domain-containing protein [Bacteriovorax sp. PP10]